MSVRITLLLAVAVVASRGSAKAPSPIFAVATIKPSKAAGWRLQPTADGYTGRGVSLRMLIQEAYGVFDDRRLSGGLSWIASEKFDIEAKFDVTENSKWNGLTYRQRADMLQPLLAERFNVKVHHEMKPFPVYNLVLAKGGSKLQPIKPGLHDDMGIGVTCHVLQNRPGYTQREDCTVASLEDFLREATGRSIVDKTGLEGHYNFELRWTPDNVAATTTDGDYFGPSIFAAVQEQMGLKLEPATTPLDVLVIDHADRPSEN